MLCAGLCPGLAGGRYHDRYLPPWPYVPSGRDVAVCPTTAALDQRARRCALRKMIDTSRKPQDRGKPLPNGYGVLRDVTIIGPKTYAKGFHPTTQPHITIKTASGAEGVCPLFSVSALPQTTQNSYSVLYGKDRGTECAKCERLRNNFAIQLIHRYEKSKG